MRVISINLNKRMANSSAQERFLGWLAPLCPDLLLVQEPWSRTASAPVSVLGYRPLGGNASVFAWASGQKALSIAFVQMATNWQSIDLGSCEIHHVYLSPYSSSDRRSFLRDLVHALPSRKPCLIVGDFNMAPGENDGLIDSRTSSWTSANERRALEELLRTCCLVDITSPVMGNAQEYTIERTQGGHTTHFRCDLAIISEQFGTEARVRYAHETRTGDRRFTDHSAVIVDLPGLGTVANGDVELRRNQSPVRSTQSSERQQIQTASTVNEIECYRTAIKRKGPSAVARAIVAALGTDAPLRVLDYGCGYGTDVSYYRECGYDSSGYDEHENFGFTQSPAGVFDLVTLTFVLNVLPTPERRAQVIVDAAQFVKIGGLLVIAARSPREIGTQARTRNWAPLGDGFISDRRKRTFQKGISRDEILHLVADSGLGEAELKLRLGCESTCVVATRLSAEHVMPRPQEF